ncbi:MAG: mechanosensitive ion channel [Opitutaceae bacterium]|nr:mechanosensitive ion channel [Opitutaceae bacterium]
MSFFPRPLRCPARGVQTCLLLAAPAALRAADGVGQTSSVVIAGSLGLAVAGLVGWITLVWWMRQKLLSRLKGLAFERTRAIASPQLRRVSLRQLLQLTELGVRLVSLGLMLAGAFVFVVVALEVIPGTRSWAGRIEHVVLEELIRLGESAASALPGIAVVAVIFFVTRIVHEVLNHYFRSITAGEISSGLFDGVTAETTRRLSDAGLWICAIIIAFPYLPGSESAAFRGVTVLAGLMISIGSANLVTQFTSGLALIYGRALRPGDYVEIGTNEGVVERIGLLACTLRTPRDEIVVLPNATVAAGLKNFSLGRTGIRFAVTVTIGYDAPWRQVRELLLAAATATPGIRAEPAPAVRQAGLDDFYVRYELLFTPEDVTQRVPLLGHLHEAIQDRFHAAGVQIMSPHYNSDPAQPKLPPAGTS